MLCLSFSVCACWASMLLANFTDDGIEKEDRGKGVRDIGGGWGKRGSVVATGLSAQTLGFSAGFALRRHPKLTCSSSMLLGMGNKSGLMPAVENEPVSELIGSIWDMGMATGPLSWICVSE